MSGTRGFAFRRDCRHGRRVIACVQDTLTSLQQDIVSMLRQYGDMEKEDLQVRLCVASSRRLDEALLGLRAQHVVIFRDGSTRGIHLLVHNGRRRGNT